MDEMNGTGKRRVPELLSPAGSFESLRAAVNAGADAVYMGGLKYGARAYADNPDEERFIEAIRYAHLNGVRVHMTVNTLLKKEELEELPGFLENCVAAGLDAAIVQDPGAFVRLREHFPALKLHASTQTTVTGPESALFYKSLGACRVIPARELSLEELSEIKRVTGMEVETFVHGALCYAYSGQCLMSSLIGGRSGNRGRCAQTCRLPYTLLKDGKRFGSQAGPCLLSCRDLCSLDILPELAEAGIDSFKIEGRMKSPVYTAGVTAIWRKYLDLYAAAGREGYRVNPEDRRRLLELFDRGGQTDGYYFRHNGPDMMATAEKPAFRETDSAYLDSLAETYVKKDREVPVRMEAVIRRGEAMTLKVSADTASGTVSSVARGSVPPDAERSPAAAGDVEARLKKTGGSGFRAERVSVDLDEGLFIPVQALNSIRREALISLKEELLRAFREEGEEKTGVSGTPGGEEDAADGTHGAGTGGMAGSPAASAAASGPSGRPALHVTVVTEEQLSAALSEKDASELSFPADAFPAEKWAGIVTRAHAAGRTIRLRLPQIFRAEAKKWFGERMALLRSAGFDGLIAMSLEEDGWFAKACPELSRRFDFNVYGMNPAAQEILFGRGAERLTLPVELNAGELKRLGCSKGELIVAGRLPMMVSAQCLKKNLKGCDRMPSWLTLKDRKGAEMPVRTHCAFCFNTILNAAPLSLVGCAAEARRLSPASWRVLLTTETGEEARRVIRAAADAFLYGKKCQDPYPAFTRGHFKRGVE